MCPASAHAMRHLPAPHLQQWGLLWLLQGFLMIASPGITPLEWEVADRLRLLLKLLESSRSPLKKELYETPRFAQCISQVSVQCLCDREPTTLRLRPEDQKWFSRISPLAKTLYILVAALLCLSDI